VQEESEKPDVSKELDQTGIQHPTMSTPPNLQTPLNEEKSLKRNREEATTSGRETTQTYAETSMVKRQRLNLASEQEFTEEIVGATSTERERSMPATPFRGTLEPSTSHTQMLERQQSVEASLFRMPTDKDQGIRERYKDIKAMNKRLKAQTYAQYLKMAPTNQTRFMSAYDVKEGKMQMKFVKPTTQQPRTTVYFKKIDFEVLAKEIHPIDQIELHKQTWEMIYSTLTGKAIATHLLQNSLNKKIDFEVLAKEIHPIDQIELHKQTWEMIYSTLTGKAIAAHLLQNSLNNISAQFQLEMASSQAKDTRIKSLEDLIIELGHDPKYVKATERLIKKKNDDIAALKKQLKIPPLHHPHTAEVL